MHLDRDKLLLTVGVRCSDPESAPNPVKSLVWTASPWRRFLSFLRWHQNVLTTDSRPAGGWNRFQRFSKFQKQNGDVCHIKYRLINNYRLKDVCSSFFIWRQTLLCTMQHRTWVEAPNQIPHPSGVVVKCPTLHMQWSVKLPPPWARERVRCPRHIPLPPPPSPLPLPSISRCTLHPGTKR